MKDMGEADVILGIRIKHEMSTPMDTSEKLMPNNGQTVSQLEYSRVIGCLMYAMTCTRPDIAFVMGKLSRYTSNPVVTLMQLIQQPPRDNSSTSGWVFLLGGGAISWASKKQTCITGSIIEYEFVALAAAGKEAECAATLAKAYSQMYNEKSRHLGMTGVFRVEYNRTNGIDKRCQVLISSDIKVVSSRWSFVSAVLGQMIYPVASLALDSARSYVILLACSIPIGWAYAFHQDKASSVRVRVANVTLFSSTQLLRENSDSVHSNQRTRSTAAFVPLK
ncbi:hypothetical protein Tco_0072416 [Tanacetum coccineum]